DWGGYLTWQGWPGLHNWIDDRNEVQGEAHVRHYFDLLAGERDWERALDRERIGLVALPPEAPLAGELLGEGKQPGGRWEVGLPKGQKATADMPGGEPRVLLFARVGKRGADTMFAALGR